MFSKILLAAAASDEVVEVINQNANAIVPEDAMGKLLYGLQVSLLGMGMVFLILILLMGVISLFKLFFYTIPNKSNKTTAIEPTENVNAVNDINTVNTIDETEDEDEIAAVISGVIAYYYSTSDKPDTKYKIRSFRRV